MIKRIRQLFLFLAVLVFASCQSHKETASKEENQSDKEKQRFIPEEYRFPQDKIGAGKTFVYVKEGVLKDTLFEDNQLVTEYGAQYLIYKRYNAKAKFDSLKIVPGGKTMEDFSFWSPDYEDTDNVCIKGKINDDKVIDNGTKLGRYYTA
jgi:hypothetical protein